MLTELFAVLPEDPYEYMSYGLNLGFRLGGPIGGLDRGWRGAYSGIYYKFGPGT